MISTKKLEFKALRRPWCAARSVHFISQQLNQLTTWVLKSPGCLKRLFSIKRKWVNETSNETYSAFMTVSEVKSDNKIISIKKFVQRRLEWIKEAADDGKKLSAEVCDAFGLLGQLIDQVVLAIVASQGANEQDIQSCNQGPDWRRPKTSKRSQKKRASKFGKGNGATWIKFGNIVHLVILKRN